MIFTNLVDFDTLFGHRRDVVGYAQSLEEFDQFLPEILDAMYEDDLLIITADHGNNTTEPGTDHTREYIPILTYHKNQAEGNNFGTRSSFADIAATIAKALEIEYDAKGSEAFL